MRTISWYCGEGLSAICRPHTGNASVDPSVAATSSSLAGFLSHATPGTIDHGLVVWTGTASAVGALIGAWLMTDKLKRKQVKVFIGVVLLGIAGKMLWGLVV